MNDGAAAPQLPLKILLQLQQMEMALVKAHLQHPNFLTPHEYHALRESRLAGPLGPRNVI